MTKYGPLGQFSILKPEILQEACSETMKRYAHADLDFLLGEALYLETARLKSEQRKRLHALLTFRRQYQDQKIWAQVRQGLWAARTEVSREALLKQVIEHNLNEVSRKFSKPVYRFATRAVPFGFNWLLNAASVKRFLPFRLSESLKSRFHIFGPMEQVQKLSEQGTVILLPTHQSNMDSILIGYLIYLMGLPPFSYGAGLNLFTNPVLSFFMSRLGAYTVDRKKNYSIYKEALKQYSTSILKRGFHSLFFPGGGRSRSGAIESHLKLGLLGTALHAQVENLKPGGSQAKLFVVPVTTSYHFVLEASSLIDEYLASEGHHRYLGVDTEDPNPVSKAVGFFWKFFASRSTVTLSIGQPMDLFGHPVDEEGRSYTEGGTPVDIRRLLTSHGELVTVPERDQEYMRQMGEKVVQSFYRENVVLTSHVVAFAFFYLLRLQYPELDLFRFLRLSPRQRVVPYARLLEECERFLDRLKQLEQQKKLKLSPDFFNRTQSEWVEHGIRHMGLLHDRKAIRVGPDGVTSDDLSLLYYYRNRLTGYGLSLLGNRGFRVLEPGEIDELGFLA